jgi:hypothetical protein
MEYSKEEALEREELIDSILKSMDELGIPDVTDIRNNYNDEKF